MYKPDHSVHEPVRQYVVDAPNPKLVARYPYRRTDRTLFFEKLRFEPKDFRYFNAGAATVTDKHKKPPGADAYIYRLPEVLLAVERGETVHWTEGEKDADALVKRGIAATSIHQGACKTTVEQAAWLRGAKRIVIWVDKDVDHWEVGAYDACLRYNRLIEVGVDTATIGLVRALGDGRKDAYDHLRRYTVDEAVPVDPQRLAEVARTYRPAARRRVGYRR